MCEQDYENKKLVIAKFSFFLQARNSNFRLSANRAKVNKGRDNLGIKLLKQIDVYGSLSEGK